MIYPIRMRAMHWVVAAVVISALGIGFLLGYGVVDGRSRLGGILFQLHVLLGVAAILFMLVRILVRVSATPPPVRGSLAAQRVARLVHALLYMLALSVPLLGYAMELAYGGAPSVLGLGLPDFGLAAPRGTQHPSAELIYTLHSYGGHVLAALLVVHVGAALWRTARARPGEIDGLQRMWRGRRPGGPEGVSDSRRAF
jgi:cytochrome b561